MAVDVLGRVIEVDATGKIVWEAKVAGACGVARLPGGTTLVAANQRVVELDRQVSHPDLQSDTEMLHRVRQELASPDPGGGPR